MISSGGNRVSPKKNYFSVHKLTTYSGSAPNWLKRPIRALAEADDPRKCLFCDHFQMGQILLATPCEGQNGDFLKAPARPQGLLSGSKWIWELFRARESPHKNFSSNAHLTAVLEHPQNGHFSTSQKIGQNGRFGMWGPHMLRGRFGPIFLKMEKWPFLGCSKSFLRCAFELKFL